ncbi:hypothetical protein DFH11DRAFT_1689882 [Phellopilus nigrolimitatus]|nr:hypothetical protein DFH11DRAFT_1689882 [Phellopilus nigrolimitatus]
MSTYGRNRDSVADLEEELYEIFTTHHDSRASDSGEPAIPARALVDVFRTFGENHDGMQLLTKEEEVQLGNFVSSNPGLEVTPSILLGFLAALTSHSPNESPNNSMEVLEDRGREEDKDDSSGLFVPLVYGRRQRTAPLHAAPSSWNGKKPLPTHRRQSDAGSYGRASSDTESTPSRSRAGSRSRPPSNPASPRGSHVDLWGASSTPVRPSSRAHSHEPYSSIHSLDMSPNERLRFDYDLDDSFERSPRRSSNSDEDDGDNGEDPTIGLVLDRNRAELQAREREESMQRVTEELQRRVAEQDRILQNRIAEHESELEQLENILEETKNELSLSKREEKELRAKETKYIHQISALESEIAKSQRALETSKASYQSLQKQYHEQCAESENLRNALRTREQQYRDAGEKISLHELEINKWQQQQEQMEQQMQHLESQLTAAREAEAQLDEQKQENLLLKETIDRMRFDMDELRTKADGSIAPAGTSGSGSHQGSISKSLGVELMRMNNGKWPGEEDSDEEDESTAVSDEGSGSGDTEGEDVVQTIITRRKKVTSRAMKKIETIEFEDVKNYSDAYTQHEESEFTASQTTQTDPEPKRSTATFSTQTESVAIESFATQTDPEPVPPPIAKAEMETQTDVPEPEPAGSAIPQEGVASSSTLPPTPKPVTRDLPPSYAESSNTGEEQEKRDMRVAAEAIRKWHKGLDVPLSPLRGGVSDDALEEWAALKDEMGFECLAIDKVLEMSLKTGQTRDAARSEASAAGGAAPRPRKNRFYNIYNTFVYGQTDADRDRSLAAGLTQAAVVLGVCVLAAGVLSGPYMHQQYHVPGGPTYYDRAAWSEFNRLYPVGEGLVPDGAATVWDFLGRVGGEAARMARGWPS